MDPILTAAGVEIAKQLIMLAFQNAQKAGMTSEQIDKLYSDQKAEFLASDPANIPTPQ